MPAPCVPVIRGFLFLLSRRCKYIVLSESFLVSQFAEFHCKMFQLKPWNHGICRWPPSARANVAVGPRSLQPRQVARCVAHATPSAVLCSRDGAPLEAKMEGVTLNDFEVNIKQTWWEHSQHTCFAKACDGGDGCVFNMHILCLWLGCASKPQGTPHLQSISARINPKSSQVLLEKPPGQSWRAASIAHCGRPLCFWWGKKICRV